jgi:hypothetical protein
MPTTWRRHAAIFGAALVAGAFEAAHTLAWQGRPAAWPIAFMVAGTIVELELLTTVFERGIARRRSAARSFVLSSALAIGLGIAGSFVALLLQRYLDVPVIGRSTSLAIAAQLGAFNGIEALGLWAVAIVIPRAVAAERLRTESELARLRANLQPHFLFNTLTTIAGLAGEDPRAARELIGALGELLRDSLDGGEERRTVDDEVAWLRRYAEILEIRHRGNLTFHWDIAPPAGGVRIPRLLLQPLLENAVKHGALRRRDGGEVSVRAAIEGARLRCVVEDNGPGPAGLREGAPPCHRSERSGPLARALGLELVTRRLELEYVGAAAFRLEADGARTRSIVELPVQP